MEIGEPNTHACAVRRAREQTTWRAPACVHGGACHCSARETGEPNRDSHAHARRTLVGTGLAYEMCIQRCVCRGRASRAVVVLARLVLLGDRLPRLCAR